MEIIKTASMTRQEYLEFVRRKVNRFSIIKAIIEDKKQPKEKRMKAAKLLASSINGMQKMVKGIEGMIDGLLNEMNSSIDGLGGCLVYSLGEYEYCTPEEKVQMEAEMLNRKMFESMEGDGAVDVQKFEL